MIAKSCVLAGPNSFSLARLHFYVFFFSNVSQMWALYCLVMFYVALKEELAPFNPVLKFVIVKAVVFFCFWQGMLLGVLAYDEDWSGGQVAGYSIIWFGLIVFAAEGVARARRMRGSEATEAAI